jgi:hypothetical protein
VITSHIRIIPLNINDLSGEAEFDFVKHGVPHYAMAVPMIERADATAHLKRETPTRCRVLVTTYGTTIAPIPWDGLFNPITVRMMVAWNHNDDGREQAVKSWDFEPAREHIIRHNLGTRDFIESVRADGQAIFAGITVLDENSIKIELTEAQAISVSVIFLL